MMTRAQAILALAARVPAEAYPKLSPEDLGVAIDGAERCAVWSASTAYDAGAKMVPATANGRLYRCVQPGTSAATEPTFSGLPRPEYVRDGSIVWRDAGPAPGERYDLSAALRAAWLMKAGRAAGDVDNSDAGMSLKASQLMEHCERMASRYGPRGVV